MGERVKKEHADNEKQVVDDEDERKEKEKKKKEG